MVMRPDLPDFKKPPLVEVALSVQFERLTEMKTHHVGLLWSEYRTSYPLVEEQPLLQPAIETFSNGHPRLPGFSLRVSESPEFPRCWFLNNDKTRLVQVQSDRFAYNWRKVEGDEQYPRYEDVRENFIKEFKLFENFIKKENLGGIKPDQCDVTYVNSIPIDEDLLAHSDITKVLKIINFDYGKDKELFNLDFEDARMHVRYVIPSNDGEPVGRLHVSLDPQLRPKDNHPIFILKLTARGVPVPADFDGVLEFLDSGRKHIVNCFTAWTTKEMHDNKWERINDGNPD